MTTAQINQSAIDHQGETSQAVLKKRLRAIIYCRVSTDKQEQDGESLEYQEEKCLQYALLHDYEVLMVLKEAKSGFIHYSLREKLSLARQMIRDGLADVIIVFDLRRFSRNFVHSAMIWEEIESHGGTIISVSENIDDSLTGKLIRSILAWSAESERHKIVEYANRHWQSRLAQNLPMGTGRAPYGWSWKDPDKTEYIINPEEAAVRFSIFQMFVELDMSLRAIAHKLTEDGVPTPSQARSGGIVEHPAEDEPEDDLPTSDQDKSMKKAWYPSTVQLLLKDSANIGVLTICKRKKTMTPEGKIKFEPHPNKKEIPGGLPAIISLSFYERAQRKLATNQVEKSHPPRDPEKYLLKGHIYCGVCGCKMTSKIKISGGKYASYYYRCANNSSKDAQCPALPVIGTASVGQYVWEDCCMLFERLDQVRETIEQQLQEHIANMLEDTRGQSQIIELEQAITYAKAERDKHPKGSYYHTLIEQDIQKKTEQLERYREEHTNSQGITDYVALQMQRIHEFLEFLHVMQGNYHAATFQQKRNALDVLGVKVFIDAGPQNEVCSQNEDQEWFSVMEASQLTGIAARTIYSCIESGRLPAERIGANILLHRDALTTLEQGDMFNPGRRPAKKPRTVTQTPKNTLQSLRQRVHISYSPVFSTGIQ